MSVASTPLTHGSTDVAVPVPASPKGTAVPSWQNLRLFGHGRHGWDGIQDGTERPSQL
jgi:hypothetical protein